MHAVCKITHAMRAASLIICCAVQYDTQMTNEFREIERKYTERKRALFDARDTECRQIESFWVNALANSDLSQYMTQEDADLLQHLISVRVPLLKSSEPDVVWCMTPVLLTALHSVSNLTSCQATRCRRAHRACAASWQPHVQVNVTTPDEHGSFEITFTFSDENPVFASTTLRRQLVRDPVTQYVQPRCSPVQWKQVRVSLSVGRTHPYPCSVISSVCLVAACE